MVKMWSRSKVVVSSCILQVTIDDTFLIFLFLCHKHGKMWFRSEVPVSFFILQVTIDDMFLIS